MTTYKCSNCDYNSKIKGSVTNHIKNIKECNEAEVLSDIVKVKCDICNKEYDTEKYLKAHKKICFQKKCVVVGNMEGVESIEMFSEKISGMLVLISSLTTQVNKLQEENKEIKKSLDNIDQRKDVEKTMRLKGYEELDDKEEDLPMCSATDIKTFVPKNYEDILKKLDSEEYNDGRRLTKFKISIKTNKGELEFCTATESGMTLNNSTKKHMYGSIEVVLQSITCRNDSKFRIIKTGGCYCSKHLDEKIMENTE